MREHSLFFIPFLSSYFQIGKIHYQRPLPIFFVPFYRQSVKYMLKPSKCLAIPKLLRTFAADLKTKAL